jgi:hypothetical protein
MIDITSRADECEEHSNIEAAEGFSLLPPLRSFLHSLILFKRSQSTRLHHIGQGPLSTREKKSQVLQRDVSKSTIADLKINYHASEQERRHKKQNSSNPSSPLRTPGVQQGISSSRTKETQFRQ